ncbi:MAG: RpiB/LacA/LacB family sugar-phosphate isomerase [Candidatus Eremiobacteraeota bacterium]|nr:RpiB/LacA/LacB family sugar-phosphate isomerase [Candidatus Eremiobacteraeota bacterium]
MRVAIGADDRSALTDAVRDALRERGHAVVPFGALAAGPAPWPGVAREVGRAVAEGRADTGIVLCWTGTGVSIAANKVSGVRAALCADAHTAAGARRWNDANVLALSMRSTAIPVALEILDAWFATAPSGEPDDRAAIADVEPHPGTIVLR